MRLTSIILLLSCLTLISSCKSTSTTQPPANAPQASLEPNAPSSELVNQTSPPLAPVESAAVTSAKLDACALLTSKEIEAVQGEAVKETKLSGQSLAGLSVSQCFFTLPTFNNSVSLMVAQKGDGAGADDPKSFWKNTFHGDKAGKKGKGTRDKGKDVEEEESTPPKKVPGLGDEAFWTGSRIGGALYVLKGDAYVRVSVGGPSDQASKMRKSKTLAQKVIARL